MVACSVSCGRLTYLKGLAARDCDDCLREGKSESCCWPLLMRRRGLPLAGRRACSRARGMPPPPPPPPEARPTTSTTTTTHQTDPPSPARTRTPCLLFVPTPPAVRSVCRPSPPGRSRPRPSSPRPRQRAPTPPRRRPPRRRSSRSSRSTAGCVFAPSPSGRPKQDRVGYSLRLILSDRPWCREANELHESAGERRRDEPMRATPIERGSSEADSGLSPLFHLLVPPM
jgi:hypothetical protein